MHDLSDEIGETSPSLQVTPCVIEEANPAVGAAGRSQSR